jgi:hypothetical protein
VFKNGQPLPATCFQQGFSVALQFVSYWHEALGQMHTMLPVGASGGSNGSSTSLTFDERKQ